VSEDQGKTLASMGCPWHFSGPKQQSPKRRHVDKAELQKVETYLRQTFSNAAIKVLARPKKNDSAEVYIGDEFIGIVFLDDEDGDRSYSFTMSILDTDLE
jgi:Protein of unknown function (DUF3126)